MPLAEEMNEIEFNGVDRHKWHVPHLEIRAVAFASQERSVRTRSRADKTAH